MFKANQGVAAIDMGSYTIKCCQLIKKKTYFELTNAAILPTASPAAAENSFVDALKPFVESVQSSKKRFRVCLSGSAVIVRRITLPIMTHSELKDAIRYEAESHIPFSIDECILDFQILNQVANQSMMNVLLVAARRSIIEERLQLFSGLGFSPECIDVNFFCMTNAFEILNDRPMTDKSFGLLNLGHQASLFVIIHESFPHFIREIPYGSSKITQILMDEKTFSEADADKLKKEKPESELPSLKSATEKGLEGLAEEVKSAIDFFENETSGKLAWIGLGGGGACAAEVEATLSKALDRRVSLWDPTPKIKVSKNVPQDFLLHHGPEMMISFGLAASGLGKIK